MKPVRKVLLTLILVFLAAHEIYSQEEQSYYIINPGDLYSTFQFTLAVREEIIRSIGSEKFAAIEKACHESEWPAGIDDLEKRTTRRNEMFWYHITLVTRFGDKAIVEIKPEENRHMPPDMVKDEPFYFVIGSSGLGNEKAPELVALEEEMNEEMFPQVLIIDPGQIISSYQFTEQESADIKNWIGEEGYDFINQHCREANYPEAINTLEERISAREEIMKYNAFLVAETGEISILEITPEENLQMPADFIPANTFYLIIKTKGIEIPE